MKRTTMRAAQLGAALLVTAGVAWPRSVEPVDAASEIPATATQRASGARIPVERTIAAPVTTEPADGETLTGTPVLSWRLAEASDGARVELSPTADFADETTLRFDAEGDRLSVPAVPGVWHWRLRGRRAGAVGETASAASEFFVAATMGGPRDDPDWANPYDVLLHGLQLGPTRDMR
jgi:hypothetical protein